MKIVLVSLFLLGSSQAFALDNPCVTKQKNAASFAIAQELAVPVQGAEVIQFTPGPWTEAMGNNSGSDQVTIRIGNRVNRGMTVKTYEVSGKQLGSSDDCKILSVVEVSL